MRKQIKTKRLRQAVPIALYRGTLTDAQLATLLHRTDLLAFDREGKAVQVFADEADRRRAYLDHRHRFVHRTNPGTRPASFWEYEPAVPPELRDEVAFEEATGGVLDPREDDSDPGALDEARRRWLRAPGAPAAGRSGRAGGEPWWARARTRRSV